MTEPAPSSAADRDRSFLGHPAGLAWLSFAEFRERFSCYGMQTLLVLYMTHRLLLPGHVQQVLGFGPLRAFLQSVYDVQSPQAMASAIFGGCTRASSISRRSRGGYLADRLTGRTVAVTLGASLMALGHFLMAFEASFLLALSCLLFGVGCFKGNISSQVGALYGDAFQVFLFAVQIAVIASPFVCGTLGEVYGWHWGFGAAGVGMLVGLVVYLLGRPTLPAEAPRGAARPQAPLTAIEKRNVWVLVALVPVLALASVGNAQIFNAYLSWAETNYQLMFFRRQMPVTWILSFGSILSGGCIVASVAFWRWWARRWREPDELLNLETAVDPSSIPGEAFAH